ncbi:MAG: glycosyltransferase family 2 protein [Nitrospirota bacterium]
MSVTVSIITVVRNGASTIRDCLTSVASQTYPVEHIIIDGGSTDETLKIVGEYPHVAHVVSEPDRGIYDAMNKGIARTTGDVIGILNADDLYADRDVVATIAAEFRARPVQSVFGDLVYVNRGDVNRIVRYYRSARCTPDRFAYGWMPAHPTFYVKRACYEQYGVFKTDYHIASDFELLARFLGRHRITYRYIPQVLIKMRAGGVSTKSWRSNVTLNREIVRACTENGIKTNYLMVYSKYLTKVYQLLDRPRR